MCTFWITISKLKWRGYLWMSRATQLMALYLESHIYWPQLCRHWPWQWFMKNNCFRDPFVFEFQIGPLPLMSAAHGEATGGGGITVCQEEQIFKYLKLCTSELFLHIWSLSFISIISISAYTYTHPFSIST